MSGVDLSGCDIGPEEEAAVLEVLRSGRLSMGPVTEAFEAALAETAGVGHCVSTSSGTAALHLAVRALGLRSGEKVVTTPFSFIASSNCLLYEGVEPIFVDIEPETLNIDPERVAEVADSAGEEVRGLLAVDVFGHPADWDALGSIAEARDWVTLEDSAESIGARYHGRPSGGLADAGVFAFYPNKQITTGEGGAFVTDDADLADRVRSLANHGRDVGKDLSWLEHRRLGWNYRLSEIAAALGLAQLRRLDDFLARRARAAGWYAERLAEVEGVRHPPVKEGVQMSWFVYVVRLDEDFGREARDGVLDDLRAEGIGCRNYFPPIHLQPVYRERFGYEPGDFPITESISERTVALPFHAGITEPEVDRTVAALRKSIAARRTR